MVHDVPDGSASRVTGLLAGSRNSILTLTNEFPRRSLHRIAPILVIGLAALIFTPASVFAQRAHLSRGLTDRLADPSTSSVNVIVQGPPVGDRSHRVDLRRARGQAHGHGGGCLRKSCAGASRCRRFERRFVDGRRCRCQHDGGKHAVDWRQSAVAGRRWHELRRSRRIGRRSRRHRLRYRPSPGRRSSREASRRLCQRQPRQSGRVRSRHARRQPDCRERRGQPREQRRRLHRHGAWR